MIWFALAIVCGVMVAGRRQEDFADAILFRALGRVEPLQNGLHFIVPDADAAFDLRLLQPTPSGFAFNLAAK